jgi:hypothetical protein
MMPEKMMSDDRAVMTTVSHVLTIGITALLVVGLLVTANGALLDEKEEASREEMRTVGNRIASELSSVDRMAAESGNVTVTANHVERIAGERYRVSLSHGATACTGGRIPSSVDTCLRIEGVSSGRTVTVPVANKTAVSIDRGENGRYRLSAETQPVTTDGSADVDQLDLSSRVGVGQNVTGYGGAISSSPGNRTPVAQLSFQPSSPLAGEDITFDASDSYDPDGNVDTYKWDWDNDGNFERSTSAPTVTLPFSAGSYNVTLQVVDDQSLTNSLSKFIDVSGVIYNEDLGTYGSSDENVRFSVTNNFGSQIKVTHVMINPVGPGSSDIDELSVVGSEIDIDPDSGTSGQEPNPVDIAPGGEIVRLDDPATIDGGSDATVELQGFEDSANNPESVDGVRLDIGIQYVLNERSNSTRFSDVTGSPAIANYQVSASGEDVDLSFDSSKQLDTWNVDVTGAVTKSIDESDTGSYTESATGTGYAYTIDVSDGTSGLFNATLTTAESGGNPSGQTPISDETLTATGDYVWSTDSDWDGGSSWDGIVHAGYGDRQADQLRLGYPTSDTNGNNLSAFWALDNNAGVPDESGNGNFGTPNNGPGETAGIFGTDALNFDGWTQQVEAADSASLRMSNDNNVTVSTWVNHDNTQWFWTALVQKDDESYNLHFYNNTPEFTIYDQDDSTWYSAVSPTAIDTNKWYHLVGTFDGNTVTLYRNGSFVDSNTSPDQISPTNDDVGIGENLDKPGRVFDGAIDETRVYDRALNATEVAALYDAATSGTYTTPAQTGSTIAPGDVEIEYDTAISGSNSVDVRVINASSPGEKSDWVTLDDGTGSKDVTGLSHSASEFKVEVRIQSNSVETSPTVDTLKVVDGS